MLPDDAQKDKELTRKMRRYGNNQEIEEKMTASCHKVILVDRRGGKGSFSQSRQKNKMHLACARCYLARRKQDDKRLGFGECVHPFRLCLSKDEIRMWVLARRVAPASTEARE